MLSQRDQAHQLGENVATSYFASMLNPRNRGVHFRWEHLDQMVRMQARTQVRLQVLCQDKNKGKLCQVAEEAASEQLGRLLEESGVEEWEPLPIKLISYVSEDEVLVCTPRDEGWLKKGFLGEEHGRDPARYTRLEHRKYVDIETRTSDPRTLPQVSVGGIG